MKGKTCIVTGSSSGIGKATAEGLAAMGATVVIVSRAGGYGASVAADIGRSTGNSAVSFMPCDLSSMASVRDFTTAFLDRHKVLHVLVNNAGGIYSPRGTTADGYEMTFAVNHLAAFLMTAELLPVLQSSAPARIVTVSSGAQQGGVIDFDDLQGERKFSPLTAYSQSKLANVVFTYELARRLAGTNVTANVLHPGTVRTGFGDTTTGFLAFFLRIIRPLLLTPEQGAATSIYLASAPEVEGVTGKYFVNKQERRSSPQSYDESSQRRLWEVSEQLTRSAAKAGS